MTQKDPYKYFRIEARELTEAMGQDILRLEKSQGSNEAKKRLLRQAHTLKGAARVVKQGRIAELAHDVESHLTAVEGQPEPPLFNLLLSLVDEMSTQLAALGEGGSLRIAGTVAVDPPTSAPQAAQEAPQADSFQPPAGPSLPTSGVLETARIDLNDMDIVLAGMAEATVRVHALQKLSEPLGQARRMAHALALEVGGRVGLHEATRLAESLCADLADLQQKYAADMDHLAADLKHLSAHTHGLRLIPATTMVAALERAVRDAAESLGKQAVLVSVGGETALDGHVLAPVRDALLHVVRNAVAHGIEPAQKRLAMGKPAAGHIVIQVKRQGSRITFTCQDDGAGIDVRAVKDAAVRSGVLGRQAADDMPDREALRLALLPGVTTAETLSEVAGRGVGMDAVAAAVARLRGHIEVHSVTGSGTTVVLNVPMSLTSLTALICGADVDATALLPLGSVQKILRLQETEVHSSAQGESVIYRDRVIPFMHLSQVLGGAAAAVTGMVSAAVVVYGDIYVAVGLHHLAGIAEVVVRPVPSLAAPRPWVAGVCLDGHGHPRPMLDPQGLVAVVQAQAQRQRAAPAGVRLPILVIDDSLTTRMLEQSILQSAGYEVDLATSGEEGLDKARLRSYGLFIVDVEMPGISGVDFVARARDDSTLRHTPAVLVTSLSTTEDKRRGLEAGARAYIVKGEFHQDGFLKIVRDFVG